MCIIDKKDEFSLCETVLGLDLFQTLDPAFQLLANRLCIAFNEIDRNWKHKKLTFEP